RRAASGKTKIADRAARSRVRAMAGPTGGRRAIISREISNIYMKLKVLRDDRTCVGDDAAVVAGDPAGMGIADHFDPSGAEGERGDEGDGGREDAAHADLA